MNKRTNIIVSIVGITIVLLALLGITYAYYLTRIEGNTNTNSISITTANLKLTYADGNGLLTATNITPGKQVEFKTSDNTTTTEKTFTVTNSGNSTIEGYAVSLDYAYIENVMPSIFERPEDFQIALTCSTNRTGETCNGFTGNFNNESIMLTSNDIEVGEIHTYSLSIYYNDPGFDQSNDMGKNLNLKIQIYGISESADIEGTITGVDSKYSVKIESEPKMSTIINGKYNFKGVEIGTHTLTILDKDGNEIDKEYIVVKSGTTPGITATKTTIDNAEVDATGITITKDERVAKLSTKVESNALSFDTSTSSTETFNPYSNNKNSLAYNIINNAQNIDVENNIEGKTIYSPVPQTIPMSELSLFEYVDGGASSIEQIQNAYTVNSDGYYTYSDSYSFSNGRYSLYNTDGSEVTTVQGISSLTGKYIVNIVPKTSSTPLTFTNIYYIYYVVAVNEDSFYYISLNDDVASNEHYFTYGDTYIFDKNTGKYSIKNSDGSALKTLQYNTNYNTLKNKYIVSLIGSTSSSPVSADNKTIIYKISNNSTSEILKYHTITKSEEQVSTEKTLSLTQDAYGTSYYYRGGVVDNYVLFNDMCFRIVRIEGDGSVKLIFSGNVSKGATNCNEITDISALINDSALVNYGFKSITGLSGSRWYIADYVNNTSTVSLKSTLDSWFYSNFFTNEELNSYGMKVKNDKWCLGGNYNYKYNVDSGELFTDSSLEDYFKENNDYYWHSAAVKRLWRTKVTDLMCLVDEDNLFSKVGTLTVDEVALAGGLAKTNTSYYLNDNSKSGSYWTLSRSYFKSRLDSSEFAMCIKDDGMISQNQVDEADCSARPAISLIPGVNISSGVGTKANPYIIDVD